jgi:hypothetical protein
MSIEKLDIAKLTQEKIPFTMHLNYVLQNVRHPLALAIWVYLTSLPEGWEVHRNQLMEHFNVGRDKLKDALSFLNQNYLLEYSQEKLENGTFGNSHILVKSGHEFEVIHRNATGGLKNRRTEKPLDGKTAPIKEIRNTKEKVFKNKSFCASAQKKSKSDWRKENAKTHDFAEAKDNAAASKKQMDREAEHIARNEGFKKAAMPQELRDKVKRLKC